MAYLILLPGAAKRHIDPVTDTILGCPFVDWGKEIEVCVPTKLYEELVQQGAIFQNNRKWYFTIQSGWTYNIEPPYQDDSIDEESLVPDREEDFIDDND